MSNYRTSSPPLRQLVSKLSETCWHQKYLPSGRYFILILTFIYYLDSPQLSSCTISTTLCTCATALSPDKPSLPLSTPLTPSCSSILRRQFSSPPVRELWSNVSSIRASSPLMSTTDLISLILTRPLFIKSLASSIVS